VLRIITCDLSQPAGIGSMRFDAPG
jgi:hypothetical protein